MKKLAPLFLTLSLFASQALAGNQTQIDRFAIETAPARVTVLVCEETQPMVDAGLSIVIETVFAPSRYGRTTGSYTEALLTEQTIAGPKTLGKYQVVRKQSDRIGAPVYFVSGDTFTLIVNVDGTPMAGGHFSTLVAEVNGARISRDLVCRFTR